MKEKNLAYLKLLSESYPTIQSAATEIINLKAILNLPKGTEYFLSDIHGEYDAFTHLMNSASGVIKDKINEALPEVSEEEKIFWQLLFIIQKKNWIISNLREN